MLPRRFLLVGIPGHYKANKSVSFMEMRGFRDRARLAAAPSANLDDGEEAAEAEEGEEEEEEEAARPKRERWLVRKTGTHGLRVVWLCC
jgi:hypothetical protein